MIHLWSEVIQSEAPKNSGKCHCEKPQAKDLDYTKDLNRYATNTLGPSL